MRFKLAIRSLYSRYADFSGRSTRAEFWYVNIWLFLGGGFFAVLDIIFFGTDVEKGLVPFSALFVLGNLVPTLALGFRRLQDMGVPGWISLTTLIPLHLISNPVQHIFWVAYFIWMCAPGEPVANRYGAPSHKAADTESAETQIEQLLKLERLLKDGYITADEFSELKNKLISPS